MNLPNRLTLLRIALVPVYLVLLGLGSPAWRWAALAVFVVASLTDLLDGHIARSQGLVTNFGKFMDPIADKLLVLPGMVMMVPLGLVPAWMCVIFVSRELVVSGLRLVAAEQGVVMAADKLGKAKTLAQVLAMGLLTVDLPLLRPVSLVLLWAALILTLWSCVAYLWQGRHLFVEGKTP